MNTRLNGEIYSTSHHFIDNSDYNLKINTNNFTRKHHDIFLLKWRLDQELPCYIVLCNEDWSLAICYYEIYAFERYDTLITLTNEKIPGFDCFQNWGYNAILKTRRSGTVCCASIPPIASYLPSNNHRQKWLITTIDNDVIINKIKKCIVDRYFDDGYWPPTHRIPSSTKTHTYYIQSKAQFKALYPFEEEKTSKYNVQHLVSHIGVNYRRIPDFNKMIEQLRWDETIQLVINNKYTAKLEGVQARQPCSVRGICRLHKDWNVVLSTEYAFTLFEHVGYMMDSNDFI